MEHVTEDAQALIRAAREVHVQRHGANTFLPGTRLPFLEAAKRLARCWKGCAASAQMTLPRVNLSISRERTNPAACAYEKLCRASQRIARTAVGGRTEWST